MGLFSSSLSDLSDNTKRKRDLYAFSVGVLSQFFLGMSNIQLKTYRTFFPDNFSTQSLTFWRSFSICIIGYFMISYKKERITPLNEIKNKFWFYMRNCGNYFVIVLWIIELSYFRVSTCQSFTNCNPIIILFLSSFILKEPFYIRYVFGVFISLIGTLMIIFNDKKEKNVNIKNKTSFDTFVGITIALAEMTSVAFINFGQKFLCNEKIIPEVQNFYLGLFNSIPAFVVMLIEKKTGLSNLYYILYAFSNGFLFYLANYCSAETLNIMPMNNFVPMNYLKVVFIFILGYIIFGEHVYFTDIIGSALIVGFQVYNVCYPVKKIINDNEIKTNFLKENEE